MKSVKTNRSFKDVLEKFAEHYNFKLSTCVDNRLGHCVWLKTADDCASYIQFISIFNPSHALVYACGHSKEDACRNYIELFLLDQDLDLFWLSSSGWNKIEGFPKSSLEELAVFLDLNV